MRSLRSLAVVAALSATACGHAPTIGSLDRTSGPPHTLVMIQGTDLDDSTIVWDSGTPGTPKPIPIPGGYLGAYMFSVPDMAAPGPHNVVVRNSKGDSKPVSFMVEPLDPMVKVSDPRIDSVTLVGTTFDTAGHVTASLYVQGANIDVGAVVKIDGVEVATSAHKALRNDAPPGVSPGDIGYHIPHFLSTVALAGSRATGAKLSITVRNLGGAESMPREYTLPTDAMHVDSDGDGLLDTWETAGYDSNGDGVIDLNLPAMGTNPYRRDILVELDAMPAVTSTKLGLEHAPGTATFDAARAMFAAAPFLSPTADPGINLILDTSGSVQYAGEVCFDMGTASGCADSPTLDVLKYSTLKGGNKELGVPAGFDNAHRDKIFHYGIWGATQTGGDSGISDSDGHSGDDFLISFDQWGTPLNHPTFIQSVRSQVEAFTHELGHGLGLHHGGAGDDGSGDDDHCYLPNHWSVMSYTWDKRTGLSDQFRMEHATCPPAYYKKTGAVEQPMGAVPTNPGTATDYSSGMGKTLKDPGSGPAIMVCNEAVNWAQDWIANATKCGSGPYTTIKDFADWPRLNFDGPVNNGWLKP